MTLKHYLHGTMIPPRRLMLMKIFEASKRKINSVIKKRGDLRRSTYSKSHFIPGEELLHYFGEFSVESLTPHSRQLAALTDLFLDHRFDLLGSGWVEEKHGMRCLGLEGYRYGPGAAIRPDSHGKWLEGRINSSNLVESQSLWSLVDQDYTPIDWHLDFKSGYRWSEDSWYLEIPHGHKPGVDIKVPWELARMQHLPLLAFAYALAKDGQKGFDLPYVYVKEFRDQVLDFIATNPPRFGVNWRSTMDVAIRVANWLVAYDLFHGQDVKFEDQFKKNFFHSVYQHGQHIVNNFEWRRELRANHYLSNIVGLLFISAYLPRAPEIDAWLALAVQELIHEVENQFALDGSNFEASTSYHRLSAEMVAYATALALALPSEKRAALENYDHRLLKGFPELKPAPASLYPLPGSDQHIPFPVWYIERLEKMAEFTMHITKPNGHIPQIGDNDSGRFFKFYPFGDEDPLDHRHLVAAINGLFNREDFAEFTDSGWIETHLVKRLSRGIRLPSYKGEGEPTTAERTGMSLSQTSQDLKLWAYPDFGVYIFRSKDVYLAIRCGSIGQNGHGGHAHNDNLSFDLSFKGSDFIVDGGSYLYTPFPEIRNRFRSTGAHSTLALKGREQNRWTDGLQGLFSMRDDAHTRALELGAGCFRGEHHGFGPRHCRRFEWSDSSLIIEDFLEADTPNEINFNLAPDVQIVRVERNGPEEFLLEIRNWDIDLGMLLKGFSGVEARDGFFSSGYGKRVKNSLVKCYRSKPQTRVEIELS